MRPTVGNRRAPAGSQAVPGVERHDPGRPGRRRDRGSATTPGGYARCSPAIPVTSSGRSVVRCRRSASPGRHAVAVSVPGHRASACGRRRRWGQRGAGITRRAPRRVDGHESGQRARQLGLSARRPRWSCRTPAVLQGRSTTCTGLSPARHRVLRPGRDAPGRGRRQMTDALSGPQPVPSARQACATSRRRPRVMRSRQPDAAERDRDGLLQRIIGVEEGARCADISAPASDSALARARARARTITLVTGRRATAGTGHHRRDRPPARPDGRHDKRQPRGRRVPRWGVAARSWRPLDDLRLHRETLPSWAQLRRRPPEWVRRPRRRRRRAVSRPASACSGSGCGSRRQIVALDLDHQVVQTRPFHPFVHSFHSLPFHSSSTIHSLGIVHPSTRLIQNIVVQSKPFP